MPVCCLIAALLWGCGDASRESASESAAEPTSAADRTAPPLPEPETGNIATLPLSGPPRRNQNLQLAVREAGFDPASPAAPQGLRYFTVGLRGLSRTANIVALEIRPYVFAQNEKGCISRPEPNATWLKRPFAEVAEFTSEGPTEGQLAFLVPDDTERVRVLIASADGDELVVPVGDDFTPTWPTPAVTIEDGSTLRVHVLPRSENRSASTPALDSNHVLLDFVVENLKAMQGIEFTTSQQLRLVAPDGAFTQPAALTKQLGCRLDDGDVVPPGQARRFMVVYRWPAGARVRLQYRGFEVDERTVELPDAS
jgi:hypothetical protein